MGIFPKERPLYFYPKASDFSSFFRFCCAASGRFAQKYIPLHKIGGGSAIKTSFIALTLHYLCIRKAAVQQFSCKRGQSSLLELPSAAENVKKIS